MTLRLPVRFPLAPSLAFCALVSTSGCDALVGQNGAVPDGHRLLSGRLSLGDGSLLGRQVAGLQVAAVAVVQGEEGLGPAVSVSDVFDPAKGGASSFAIAVPVDRAFSLVLQVPRSSGRGPGTFLGAFRFDSGFGPETSLIPAGEGAIDVGTLSVDDSDPGTTADNRLVGAASENPLAQSHSDPDEVNDLLDDDDDNDGVTDAVDPDVAGDGVDDVLQGLEALPDEDGSGVPDAFES